MTTTAELAKPNQRLEWILCIEGIGWPSDMADLSQGFDGDIFTTADLNGDLASQLGCSIHEGLSIESTIMSRVDVLAVNVDLGSLECSIVDADDFLLGAFKPHATSTDDTLAASLDYEDTTVQTTSGSYSTGDVVFIGGRECVKLGTKSTNNYTGSTRGYLGTPRGRLDATLASGDGLNWASGISICSINRYWSNRRMAVYLHVPGEAPSGCLLAWVGLLRGVRVTGDTVGPAGSTYKISGVADIVGPSNRIKRNVAFAFESDFFEKTRPNDDYGSYALPQNSTVDYGAADAYRRVVSLKFRHFANMDNEGISYADGYRLMRAMYQYRTEPGGTSNLYGDWNTPPLAGVADTTEFADLAMSYIAVGGKPHLLINRSLTLNAWHSFNMQLDPANAENGVFEAFGGDVLAYPMLDNMHDAWAYSRFSIDRVVRRNAIDVALMFLTSMPSEFFRGDASAVSGDGLTYTFAGASFETNMWAGAALHGVEGNNKNYARTIASNTSNTITLDAAFPNNTTSVEYQVRNSIYDVLPIGWGLGVHWSRIDIAGFEATRDKYLSQAELGRFMVGAQPLIDLWGMLKKNIFEPYGVLPYLNRSTAQLSALFVGDSLGDGIDQTYLSVQKGDIINVGSLDYGISRPVGSINLTVRRTVKVLTKIVWQTYPYNAINEYYGSWGDPILADAEQQTITLKLDELEGAFLDGDLESASVQAMFNSEADAAPLIGMLVSRLRRNAIPRPRTTLTLDIKHYPELYEGRLLSLTYSDQPINPYTGARGWSGLVARVLGIGLSPGKASVAVDVELLQDLNGCLLAPSAIVTGTGTSGSDWYISVTDNHFMPSYSGTLDWYGFAVGDEVSIYDNTGLADGVTVGTITSFGANQASTPEGASTSVIFVSGDLTSYSYASGDYLAFKPWNASTPTQQKDYAAFADDSTQLLAGTDAAKEIAG